LLKDVKIGNTVEIFKHEGKFKYYGPLNIVYSTEQCEYSKLRSDNVNNCSNYNTTTINIANYQNKRYVFINEDTNQLVLLSTPKIVNKFSEDAISKQEGILEINQKLHTLKYDVGYSSIITFVSEKPIQPKDFVIKFEPSEDNTLTKYFDNNFNYYDEIEMVKCPLLKHYISNGQLKLSIITQKLNTYTNANFIEHEELTEIPKRKYVLTVEYNNQTIKQPVNFL
jgi:hypothetical protein